MRLRALSVCLLLGAATLIVPACRSGAPGDEPQQSARPAPRRAIVPLTILQDRLAICRLDSGQPLPFWTKAPAGEFSSVTRTPEELSIIVAESRAPEAAKCERGYRLLKVQGPLDFNLVGIFAGLSGTLADAGVSILGLSTFDTDYVFVKQADFDRALAALRQAGYTVTGQ